MCSASDQPTTRRECMSITVARYIRDPPTGRYVMSPHQRTSGAGASKTGPTRSGAGGTALSATVMRTLRRRCRPAGPRSRISRATRLWFTGPCRSRSSRVIRGTP
ncbi:hypothetical protein SVTN_00335 [Streptomyces vietnamensis]|uniref:Uncharacterized protein n=1 Tax=Streptomyces vietnamensis TaxID=362257 RepID=A0A0B5I0R5_9ACTN|nr:hypothetical protein SVTN_00335 [Streptomyces vietnamensis]